jgi:hypothetical protein
LIARATVSIAARIAALNHKVWHDAVKRNPVEIATFGELDKVIDVERRFFWPEFDCK